MTFKRPGPKRKFIVVEAELKGGSREQGYPDALHISALALTKEEKFHRRCHDFFEFVQEEAEGGHVFSSAISGVAVTGFANVTITRTQAYTRKGLKDTTSYVLG